MKLLLTVLVLIVLPTAWLSMLAGRSTHARELLLDRRLEAEAQQALEKIATETQRAMDAALEALPGSIWGSIFNGEDIRHLDITVSPVNVAASLYVGYEMLQDDLITLLEQLLSRHSTPHIAYRLLHGGAVYMHATDAAVPARQMRDGLSLEEVLVPASAGFRQDAQRSEILVSRRLREPFDFIEIGAFAVNAPEMYAARALQARLVRWSILLLAFVLLSSVVILILMTRRQVAQARMRSIFIAGLSHDIRTPVTAMRALAESLQQGRVAKAERRQQFLDSIVVECDRLQTLIERVLLFFRQEQGGYYQKHALDLVGLCERVGNAFCVRHRGRVDLRLDLPEGVRPTMWGDGMALEQALHNLLENAWKYGRPSPGHPDLVIPVCLRLTVDSGCVWRRCLRVAVEDAGPGVDPEEQNRVFSRFYRGHSAGIQQSGGMGLGLALVWEIVRGHGGRVYIERSTLGGARIVIRFKPFPLCAWSWRYFLRGLWLRIRA